jgi:hypothetical protein
MNSDKQQPDNDFAAPIQQPGVGSAVTPSNVIANIAALDRIYSDAAIAARVKKLQEGK